MNHVRELRAEAARCRRAMGTVPDETLKERLAARAREFALLADVLERGRRSNDFQDSLKNHWSTA
jgi:hypothetical protein